jgi:hypothetical protein
MSMSSEPENFEALRRLLVIKRHEQPPPGYFNDFSRQVICRIRANEAAAGESLLARLLRPAQSLWTSFEAKPIVAGAFGVGVCSLLVIGLISSERIDADPNGLVTPSETAPINLANVPSPSIGSSLFDRAVSDRSNTGSVYRIEGRSSIFDEIQRPHVQPVNFSVPSSAH